MAVPFVSYKRPQNLRDLLVHAKSKQTIKVTQKDPQQRTLTDYFSSSAKKQYKIAHCGLKNCVSCKFINLNCDTFTSTKTGREYTIREQMNCTTENLVYLITCKSCKYQYCGETSTSLRVRLSNHRCTIKNNRNYPVAKHFNKENHSVKDLEIIPIEKIRVNSKKVRQQREAFWIFELRTLYPEGINVMDMIL